jgi:UDP-2,4-diacetamido-2,4,6-trideoxy-beta-L-altropyranose hydrolase
MDCVVKRVLFRVDASLQMGTGHVMRCLTLADALVHKGVECQFLCREHPGHLVELIRSKGYAVHVLSCESTSPAVRDGLAHAAWLGATQEQDAQACKPILHALRPDWVVVDHYALDSRWELALKPCYRKLMVIDDLADRPHQCELLLDQTFSRDPEDYRAWVPSSCRLLCGSQHALLRPEFAILRPYSLQRRSNPQLRQLLITMGGVDKDNATGQVLEALRTCPLPADCQITVVMGATAPWLSEVNSRAQTMPWSTRVLVGVSDMARLMADNDLAIGAAGATSWERCCLGLPTVMLVLADNQQQVAQGLEKVGATLLIDGMHCIAELLHNYLSALAERPISLLALSLAAATIVEGHGTDTVVQQLES